MTIAEKKIYEALNRCSFQPGSFDKRFVAQLDNWVNRDMTQKGRDFMLSLLSKYKRQIPNYLELRRNLLDEQIKSESPGSN